MMTAEANDNQNIKLSKEAIYAILSRAMEPPMLQDHCLNLSYTRVKHQRTQSYSFYTFYMMAVPIHIAMFQPATIRLGTNCCMVTGTEVSSVIVIYTFEETSFGKYLIK